MGEVNRKVIVSNLRELTASTIIATELVISLLENGLINAEEMDLFLDSGTSNVKRANSLYMKTASRWDDSAFEEFKKILQATGYTRAYQVLTKAAGGLTQATTTSSQAQPNSQASSTSTTNLSSADSRLINTYKDGNRFALIVNVPTARSGAEKDEMALENTLRHCNFHVDKCVDWTRQGITDKLGVFQKKVKNATKDGVVGAVVIAVASHGDNYDYFFTSDGATLDLGSDVIDLFNGAYSPELVEVPKVFLVNVCRGDKVDAPRVQTDSSGHLRDPTEMGITSWQSWWENKVPAKIQTDSLKTSDLPTWAHLLVAFASYDGHVAYRDPQEGTWFIQQFCETVKALTKDNPTCIKVILDQVSEEVSRKSTEKGEKQMPTMKNVGFSRSLLLQYRDEPH